MDATLKNVLEKIDFDKDLYSYLEGTIIKKVIVDDEKKIWNIYLEVPKTITYKVIKTFIDKIYEYEDGKYIIKVYISSKEEDLSLLEEYYMNILKLINDKNIYYDMFFDRLIKIGNKYYIEIYNKHEELVLGKLLPKINEYLKSFGFITNLESTLNKEKSEKVKEEIILDFKNDAEVIEKELSKKTQKKSIDNNSSYNKYQYKKKVPTDNKVISNTVNYNEIPIPTEEYVPLQNITKPNTKIEETTENENIIFGNSITSEEIPLSNITQEINNVTVSVKIFGVMPSTKKGIYAVTLKTTDDETSIYINIFATSSKDYNDLLAKLKNNMWIKVNGYVKFNTYRNDLVINARSIEKLDKKEQITEDRSVEKRVELHTHTLMSQMDGVVDVTKLVERAIKYGHKAIAITDHNSIQTFPFLYHTYKDIKIIYGVELNMIDDDLDLVINAKDDKLLESTYVIFDFETTGFNAGGKDKIIEVGAVKMQDGKVIERFDSFINPNEQLEDHIIKLTNITNDMLKDAPNEKETIIKFKEFIKDYPLVAHNAKFDRSFLEIAFKRHNLGEITNTIIDTLQISRVIDTEHSKHSLSALVKRYNIPWDETAHHRADYDSEATGLIFFKMLKLLNEKKIITIKDMENLVSKENINKYGEMYHITLLVKNQTGLKNLFKLISLASTKYLYKTPRILKSEINSLREGILVGSSCANGEIFTLSRSKSDEELSDLMNFYDYIEVQPPEIYKYLIDLNDFKNEYEIRSNIEKIIDVAKSKNMLVVATGDVHQLDRKDNIYRKIIINQKVPGGGLHPLNKKSINDIPSMHFRTTDEMLEDFNFLSDEIRDEIVIKNTNYLSDQIESIEVIPDTKGIPFSPKFEGSNDEIRNLVYKKAREIYGEDIHNTIKDRIENELSGIINGGFDTIYLIAQKLVAKSNNDGYSVGSRGSVGSSFVATMLGISEVNPLPAHYICAKCHNTIFEENGKKLSEEYASGYDLPDKKCICGCMMKKEGQDMPFATFLGFNADKVPDIDLNFSGEYQSKAHDYTKELFGESNVFRAGTIGTVKDKTAYGFVKGYFEDNEITNIKSLDIERLAIGITGVKRTTGQHPGGIVVIPKYKEVFDFTPYQYPADTVDEWYTTHFNYHDIEECLLKLDILGHDNPTIFKMLEELTNIKQEDIPMDDKKVISLFTSTKALNVTPDEINCNVGCLGLPEFTRFVISIVEETKPTTFAELVKISGLSHGTDVWNDNAQELVRNNICPFKDVIGCRDDIMVYLSNKGLKPIDAFKIMEFVRKGKPSKEKEKWEDFKKILNENNIPKWYIDSCGKIKYMFPKAHATAYVSAAFRIAWFKINYPIEYYATFFSIKCFSFDLEIMKNGCSQIKEKLEALNENRYSLSVKDADLVNTLEVALEMCARGYKFGNIDLMRSDCNRFIIDDDKKTLIPPFRVLEGLGDTVGKSIIIEREKEEFFSIEDVCKKCKISKTVRDKMQSLDIFKGLPDSSQMSIFDMI